MDDSTFKEALDDVYSAGFRNGALEMKNKVLKSINRDWNLFGTPAELKLMVKVMKKINRLTAPIPDLSDL
jgi:hypothetical protein